MNTPKIPGDHFDLLLQHGASRLGPLKTPEEALDNLLEHYKERLDDLQTLVDQLKARLQTVGGLVSQMQQNQMDVLTAIKQSRKAFQRRNDHTDGLTGKIQDCRNDLKLLMGRQTELSDRFNAFEEEQERMLARDADFHDQLMDLTSRLAEVERKQGV